MSSWRGLWCVCRVDFFSISHGKSACDGIGSIVKRLTRTASLQRPSNNQILSLDAIFTFCIENIPGITFFKLLEDDIITHTKELSTRFEKALTIQGTQQFHRFVPLPNPNRMLSKSVLKPTHLNLSRLQILGSKEMKFILILKNKIMSVALMMMNIILA